MTEPDDRIERTVPQAWLGRQDLAGLGACVTVGDD